MTAHFEAQEAAFDAKLNLHLTAASLQEVKAALAQSKKQYENEKAEEARLAAIEAQAAFEKIVTTSGAARDFATRAKSKTHVVEAALTSAQESINEQILSHKEAKGLAKTLAKDLQQARIARKKVAQALEASKAADEDRDLKAERLRKCKVSEEVARTKPSETQAIAEKAESIASNAEAMQEVASGMVQEAEKWANLAEEECAARERAWLSERREADAQNYAPPQPSEALRDEDVLEEYKIRRVLCRLRPRLSRLLAEMAACDELFGVMGAGRCSSGSPMTWTWTFGLARTQQFLSRPFASSNGDVVLYPNPRSPFNWRAALRGPLGTPYEGFYFAVSVEFIAEWPAKPPKLKMETPIFHINFSEDGIVHDNAEPLCSLRSSWSFSDTVFPMLGALMTLMCLPDLSAIVRPDAGDLYEVDRAAFAEAATTHAFEHALPAQSAPPLISDASFG